MYDPYTYGKYIMRKTYETYLSITKKKKNRKDEHHEEEGGGEGCSYTHYVLWNFK